MNKKGFSLFLALLLLFSVPCLASDGASLRDAVRSYAGVLQRMKGGFTSPVPQAFEGKTIIAVLYDLEADALETSLDSTGAYRSVPASFLASSLSDADWLLLVYPAEGGDEARPCIASVFPVDLKSGRLYWPYSVDRRSTTLSLGESTFTLDDTLRRIEGEVLQAAYIREKGDEAYRTGLKYMEEKKFFSASLAFLNSSDSRAKEQLEKCRQPWPRNGEIWHLSSVTNKSMELTIQVNQSDSTAYVAKIYKNGQPVSILFIGGSGKATVSLPGGTYVIKNGSGSDWFGEKELFGRHGAYNTMTFDDKGTQEVTLQSGYAYTISVNVAERAPGADQVGSEKVNWADLLDEAP